jgi:hypothetical protein
MKVFSYNPQSRPFRNLVAGMLPRSWILIVFLSGILASAPIGAQIITNGDFETGDFTGWTAASTGSAVSSTSPLAGTYSAVQTPGPGAQLYQTFTPITVAATTSFVFSATDPGGAGDRSMNVAFRDSNYSGGAPQINLRLVDLDDNGVGDIQAFSGIAGSGGAWQTVLTDAVTFGTSTSGIGGIGGDRVIRARARTGVGGGGEQREEQGGQ